MNKKMTSGEIAKKAGVSQKAVRLYDEKGLLKPTDYSEGNYRLYDHESLVVLEKIVALKQIGFSLEEIRDNLIVGEASNVEEALAMQIKAMEEKKYQIQKVIDSINRVFARKDKDLDWDDVADIVKNVQLDQTADENHWHALSHLGEEMDWYVKIFNYLNISENKKVLDLGCGYAKLWRNNWMEIPAGTRIFAYDLHGSWADDFAGYLNDNKENMPKDVEIDLKFEDIENEITWEMIKANQKYDVIVAHYLDDEVENMELLVERASKALSDGGVFSANGKGLNAWHEFAEEIFDELGIDKKAINIKKEKADSRRSERIAMLERYFGNVESVILPNKLHYTDAKDIANRLEEQFTDIAKVITSNKDKFEAYLSKKIEKDGEIVIDMKSQFWRCTK